MKTTVTKTTLRTVLFCLIIVLISVQNLPAQESVHLIAFDSNRDGDSEIYTINADGTDLRKLTNNDALDSDLSWSPDGQHIAFNSNRDGNMEIYIMDADGSNQQRLTSNSADDMLPTWSPDGQRIAFNSNRDGNMEIYVMEADGSNQQRLTSNSADDSRAHWSPDGQHILFDSERDGNLELYLMEVTGENVRRLTDNTWRDMAQGWSPDGSEILFATDVNGNFDIYAMNVDGTALRPITDASSDEYTADWSPDGEQIAVTTVLSNSDWDIHLFSSQGAWAGTLTDYKAIESAPAWQPLGEPQPIVWAGFTDDDQFGAVTLAENGETLISITEKNRQGEITKVTGAIWISPEGAEIVTFLSDDGLPETIIADDYVYQLDNYNGATIDITTITPEGAVVTITNLTLPDEVRQLLDQLMDEYQQQANGSSNYTYTKRMDEEGLTLVSTIRMTARAVGVFSCVGGFITAIPTAGVALALGCGSTVIGILAEMYPDSQLAQSLDSVTSTVPALSCLFAAGEKTFATECVEFALESAADIFESASSSEEQAKHLTEPEPTDTPIPTDTPVPTNTPKPTNTPVPQPCTVWTSDSNVQVRTGPGTDRTVINALPTNRNITVLGEDASGDWWQLEKSEASPGAQVLQSWVRKQDVRSQGDCDLNVSVAATAAPVRPQPTAVPTRRGAPTSRPDDYDWDNPYISFTADRTTINRGQCVTIRWDVEYIKEVYFDGRGVQGHGSSVECPRRSTRYSLRIIRRDNSQTYRYVSITVRSGY